ncbi:putative membrane protein [Kroppenstedtia sanguinis]|uniref:Sporulation protein YjcZ n=1 Tax=Kroppenstedtia sanguinis TaxID=1380684 RepID=A0ABW4C9D8_9BACL
MYDPGGYSYGPVYGYNYEGYYGAGYRGGGILQRLFLFLLVIPVIFWFVGAF